MAERVSFPVQKVFLFPQLHSPFASSHSPSWPGPSCLTADPLLFLTADPPDVSALVLPPWLTRLQAAPLVTLHPGLPLGTRYLSLHSVQRVL